MSLMTETKQTVGGPSGEMTPLALAKEIRPLLTRAELLYSRRSEESQLSRAQLSIMMTLEALGPCRINQLAQAEAIRMPTASNAVHHLEDAGWSSACATPGSPRRPRGTDGQGAQRAAPRVGQRDQQMAAMFRELNEAELEVGARLVPILKRILETYGAHSGPSES